jgi:tRNA A37 threonylcarbamoyladenosine dehydratase
MPFDERTRIIIGDGGARVLAGATVGVFGLGGVGAAAAMDLVRAGVGRLRVLDFDPVQESNLNRLYFGYDTVIGQQKTLAFSQAARHINPAIIIDAYDNLVRGGDAADYLDTGMDFCLDCIDTLNPKVNLIAALLRAGLPFASCMGTAGRLAPERLRVGSLWDSNGCPLAQRVRQRLRRQGYKPEYPRPIVCVWSDEPAAPPAMPTDGTEPGQIIAGVRIRAVQGSAPFVPQAAGHIMASLAVRAILGKP